MKQLHSGGEEDYAAIFERYSKRLVELADSRLNPQVKGRIDGDDIVQSVFRTLFVRMSEGQFSFDHSGALWRLLVTITLRKTFRAIKKLPPTGPLPPDDEILSKPEPTPQEVVIAMEVMDQLLDKFLPHERQIVELRFEGHSTPEIAARLNCSRTTVWRVLKRAERVLRRLS